MAHFYGMGSNNLASYTPYAGAEPIVNKTQHGALVPSGAHTIHYGEDNKIFVGELDQEAGEGIIKLGGTNASGVEIGRTGYTTRVKGDLAVDGTTVSIDSETVLIADNHLYLNQGYTVDTAQTGGLVVNYLPETGKDDTVANPGGGLPCFLPGVAANTAFATLPGSSVTTNATTTLVGSGTTFLTDLKVGQTITVDPGGSPETRIISAIASDTSLTVTIAFVGSASGLAAQLDQANPKVRVTTGGLYANYDFIQISDATETENNGLFEVLSDTGNWVTIRGVGATSCKEDFTQNQFVWSDSVVGDINQVNVSILRAGIDGLWEVAQGKATSVAGLTFTNLATSASLTLQNAYDNGNGTIVTDATGNFAVSGTQGATFNMDENSSFNVNTGDLTLSTTASGTLTITSAALLDINAGSTGIDVDTSGQINLDSSQAAATAIVLNTSNAAGGIDINAGTGGIDINTTGGVAIDAAGNITLTSTATGSASSFTHTGAPGQDLTLSCLSGSLNLSAGEAAADAISIQTATGGIDVNGALQVNIDSSQAASTALRLVASDVAGGIDIDAGATSGIITMNAGGAITLTGAGINLAGGSTEIDITTTGALDLNSGAGTWDSSAGIGLTAAGGSSFTTSSGALTLTGAATSTWSTTAGDLTIGGGSQVGSVFVQSVEAVGDAVYLNASDNAGGVKMDAGIGGAGTLDINVGTGGITIDTGGTLSIDAAGATNLTTSSSTMTVQGASALNLNASTAGANVVFGAGTAAGRGDVIIGSDSDTSQNQLVVQNGGDGANDFAAELILQNNAGKYFAIWVDTNGLLRIYDLGTSLPASGIKGKDSDTGGTVVGMQNV